MRDQVQKLQEFINMCVIQSSEEEEGETNAVPKQVNNCSLLFGHPVVFVDNRKMPKIFKRKDFQKRVKVDKAHLILQ